MTIIAFFWTHTSHVCNSSSIHDSGNPLYPDFHPSGLYAPQCNVGGYAVNPTLLPPFMGGYPSHGAVPVPFDTTASGSSFNNRTSGASTGESTSHISDLQLLGHFYGQHGLVLPPSVVDLLHMQYLQHSFSNVFGVSVQHGHLAPTGVSGGQVDSFVQKESTAAAYIGDPKLQPPINGRLSIPSPGKVGGFGGSYYGGRPSMGVIAQYPTSPLASPLMPSTLAGGISPVGHRNEISVDQHGSRFIQQKLEHCSVEDKESVFKEVLPHALRLMTDVFGNYVIQKFFEHGSSEHRKELADQLVGNMLNFSLQMYGCRVIQKALEVIELDQKIRLVQELEVWKLHGRTSNPGLLSGYCICGCLDDFLMFKSVGMILELGYDGNSLGNVNFISDLPIESNIVLDFTTCSIAERELLVEEIIGQSDKNDTLLIMMKDQFANYVVQKVLIVSNDRQRELLLDHVSVHLNALKKYTYGKHIVARFEQLLGEGFTAKTMFYRSKK
ncbi:hypothetical protein CRYUN_Cryun32bG0112700 [Craigia yunnanensis]